MPRRRLIQPSPGCGLGEWLAEEIPKVRRTGTLSDYEAAKLDAETRSQSGDWMDANPSSFVGLYAICHERLYRVEPLELKGKVDFRTAVRMASMMLARFNNDGDLLAQFIVWTWKRQKSRAEFFKKRDEESGDRGGDTFRLGYRMQFSQKTETDFRVDLTSRRGAKRG